MHVRRVVVGLFAILAPCCTSPEADWAQIEAHNSVAEYRRYLSEHPNGQFARNAEAAIERIDFEAAQSAGSVGGFQKFLDQHPDGARAPEARKAIEEIEFAAVRASGRNKTAQIAAFRKKYPSSPHLEDLDRQNWADAQKLDKQDVYEEYLACHPEGRGASVARSRIAEMEWETARRADTPDAYQKYLKVYRGGSVLGESEIQRAELELAWCVARRTNTEESYASFLSAHPNSDHAGDAQTRLESLVWNAALDERELARGIKNRNGWKQAFDKFASFATQFPDGSHLEEARAAIEEVEWEIALLDDDVESYRSYVARHPAAKQTSDAKSRLAEAESRFAGVQAEWDAALAAGSVVALNEFLRTHVDGPVARRTRVAIGQLLLKKLGYFSEAVDGRNTDTFQSAVSAFRKLHVSAPEFGSQLLAHLEEATKPVVMTFTGEASPREVEVVGRYKIGITKVGGFVYAIGGVRSDLPLEKAASMAKSIVRTMQGMKPGQQVEWSQKDEDNALVTDPNPTPPEEDAQILEEKLYSSRLNTPRILGYKPLEDEPRDLGGLQRVWEAEPGFLCEFDAEKETVQVALGPAEIGWIVYTLSVKGSEFVDQDGRAVAWPPPVWYSWERVKVTGVEQECKKLELCR